MTRKILGALLGSLCFAGIVPAAPNIVFIFIDDIGWGDMSCYGSPHQTKAAGPITPNLDAIAAEGIRFTDGYVASPVCSPSRVGVLTGIEPCRFAIHDFLNNKGANDNRNMNDWLDEHTVTSARWFQRAGYATGMFGKWHMGGGRDVNDAPFPQDYGFDESLTSFEGMGDRILYLDDGVQHGLSQQNADVPGSIEWVEWELGADKHTDAAIAFITDAVNEDRPFYVHVPHDDTHAPYDTDPGKENDFDHITTNTNGKLFLSELHELDKEIGRLVDAIDALGVADETLIVIVGDNGAPDDNIETLLNRNGGLRGGKKSIWEGGLRNPFIIRMPGTVPAGVVNTTTAVSTLDLFPTYCSMAGLPEPDAPLAGENMHDVFLGATRPRATPMFWEFATNPNIVASGPKLAMREGDFKLLRDPDGSNRRLFDMTTNQEEDDAENLIDDPSHAARVASMEERLIAWYREALLGQFDRPRTGISSLEDGPAGVASVRYFWETPEADWVPPMISRDLVDWDPVAFDSSDAEIDFGTLRWLEIPIPTGYEDRAFLRSDLPEAPSDPSAAVYLVASTGEIRRFTGVSAGLFPLNTALGFAGGESVATVAGYGSYQGFTQLPGGSVYGVTGSGDVHEWATLQDWLDGNTPVTASSGAYNADELHGLSYNPLTGGIYVIYEGDHSARGDGDLGEYPSLADFINDTNAVVTASTYGGNITNFYYPHEDAPGNANDATPGSNYFQVAGNGNLEGWLSLEDYAVNKPAAGGREFLQTGFGGVVGGFAVMEVLPIHFVSSTGEIRVFTGMDLGGTPVNGSSLGDGILAGTVAGYGSYQGFTRVPGGAVYGVASNGDVHEWSNVQSWVKGGSPATVSTGAYNPGELHGLSHDAATGGVFVIYEGSNSTRGDGDLGEYPTLADFIADTNAAVTPSVYGGNILNYYYPGEDTPGNANDAHPGSNYFQVSGGGDLEGWLTLGDYTVNKTGAGGREFLQGGYGNAIGAFAGTP